MLSIHTCSIIYMYTCNYRTIIINVFWATYACIIYCNLSTRTWSLWHGLNSTLNTTGLWTQCKTCSISHLRNHVTDHGKIILVWVISTTKFTEILMNIGFGCAVYRWLNLFNLRWSSIQNRMDCQVTAQCGHAIQDLGRKLATYHFGINLMFLRQDAQSPWCSAYIAQRWSLSKKDFWFIIFTPQQIQVTLKKETYMYVTCFYMYDQCTKWPKNDMEH